MFLLLAAACAASAACSRCGSKHAPEQPSPRQMSLLAGGWRFMPSNDLDGAERVDFDESGWQAVAVPHTWSIEKPRTFRRAWYRLRFRLPRERAQGRAFLVFEGVSAIADVFVNGVHLGQHRGAYTRFAFDATRALVPAAENLVAVRVSNDPRDTEDCLPSGMGAQHYYVFGGIHRKVWLLTTANCHFDPVDHGAPGVILGTRRSDRDAAEFEVRARLVNRERVARRLDLRLSLAAPSGANVWSQRRRAALAVDQTTEVVVEGRVSRPMLWGPESPALYSLEAELFDGESLVDALTLRTGFRDFRSVDDRFFLNGEPILLRGVGKHEETERHRSAVTDEEIRRDFKELKELGVNIARLAHYPHSALAYDLADEMGLLVWAENGNSNPVKAGATGERITREMVRQNGHHPSIVIWAVGNECDYRGVDRYSAVVKAEDPTRPIAYATNTHARPHKRDLSFVAHNVYRGWYRGDPWEWEALARAAKLISECGAGSVVTDHTDYKRAYRVVDHFEPEEYRQLVAEAQLAVVFGPERERLPMYIVWLLRDFATDKYKGVLNTKGLLTSGGLRKDAFYLYQSFLRPATPVVHITSKTYFLRRGAAKNGVKVYSNRDALRLTVNGRDAGRRKNGAYRHANGRVVPNVFFWDVRMRIGRNAVRVTDDAGHADEATVYYHPPGSAAVVNDGGLVRDLRSSNADDPAYYVDLPVREEWPFYYEHDGTADNTFVALPRILSRARFISTRRLSKPGMGTRLSFVIDPKSGGADLFVLVDAGEEARAEWNAIGFRPMKERGLWRDAARRLVSFNILRREARPGEMISLPEMKTDAVVVVKKR